MAWLSALLKTLPFANATMLLWGLAAGMPIIIHLLSRRKYSEVTWAAMEFLMAALRKNARRIRIEQLILLLVRVAILILLGIALADPIFSLFPTLGTSLGTAGRTHYVLVLDDAEVGVEHNTTTIVLMPSDFVTMAKGITQVLQSKVEGGQND